MWDVWLKYKCSFSRLHIYLDYPRKCFISIYIPYVMWARSKPAPVVKFLSWSWLQELQEKENRIISLQRSSGGRAGSRRLLGEDRNYLVFLIWNPKWIIAYSTQCLVLFQMTNLIILILSIFLSFYRYIFKIAFHDRRFRILVCWIKQMSSNL